MLRVVAKLASLLDVFTPQSVFGRLFGLVVLAVLASHLMIVIELNLRQKFLWPPGITATPHAPGISPMAAELGPRPGPIPPGGMPKDWPPHTPEYFVPFGHLFWLGLGAQCLLVLGVALWSSRMLTAPIERLAKGAIAIGDDLQNPPLSELGPMEVRMAIRGFNQMQVKLKHQLAERTQFLLAVSHDLRTPLTRMRLRYEQLPEGELQQKLLQDWKDLSQLVESTLDYVRGQDVPGNPVVLDIETLISAQVEDRQDLGQSITLIGSAKPLLTRPEPLRRCLQNLLDNAITYGNAAQVELVDSPAQLSIHIRDYGTGVPQDQLSRIMEPFVRLEASRNRNTGGLGLGLSIARDCARSALGNLSLSNHPEGGLVATLTFPRN